MAMWPWVQPHERQGQNLDDFPAIKRWFAAIEQRPALQRAFSLGHERHADREGYRHLYGQTAASLDGGVDSGQAKGGKPP
jgi:GSH-dependent disulfide-bond oxidoreductase